MPTVVAQDPIEGFPPRALVKEYFFDKDVEALIDIVYDGLELALVPTYGGMYWTPSRDTVIPVAGTFVKIVDFDQEYGAIKGATVDTDNDEITVDTADNYIIEVGGTFLSETSQRHDITWDVFVNGAPAGLDFTVEAKDTPDNFGFRVGGLALNASDVVDLRVTGSRATILKQNAVNFWLRAEN